MLFKVKEFTVRLAGDDHVGLPFRSTEEAILALDAHAIIDAKLREMMERRDIVPWPED